ncbi:MAG: M12 family metallo-peptidase [Phycisphaerales bacterium]|nr:M12 family metallo-peptidase [Phycisphaerales bacterium]
MLAMIIGVAAAIGAAPMVSESSVQPPDVTAFGGVAVTIDHQRVGEVRSGEIWRAALPTGSGQTLLLELERFEVFTEDASLVVASVIDDRVIERPAARPDVVFLRGRVVGDTSSRAFLALGPSCVNGYVDHGDSKWVLAQPPDQRWTAVYDLNAIDPEEMRWVESTCVTPAMPGLHVESTVPGSAHRGINCPPSLRMAIETDWQFTSLFGGDTTASAAYASTLIGAVSSIYLEQLDFAVQICYLRLWDTSSDPWSTDDSGSRLGEFASHWNSQMDHVDRHLAHMLSGQGLGGGVAYVGVVCTSSGYAVSGNLSGSFPLPIEDHSNNNWDLMVVAHETGHNCGTGHTHDYNPPIDGCGNGDCADAWGGTIMSYCHLCSGGISNMVMDFHPQIQTTIENYMANISCELGGDGSPPVANLDRVQAVFAESLEIDVLLNDYTNDCSDVMLLDYDTVSSAGGAIELVDSDIGRLRYSSPSEPVNIDGFFYEILDGSGQDDRGGVLIDFILPRPADTPTSIAVGTTVRYYDLEPLSALPDFDELTPIGDEVLADINLPSTGGIFAGSGLSDDVGAVFEGLIEVPITATYTLYVESDDGSRLLIGDDEVVNNDGLHAMNEESGTMLLAAGLHHVRVEFFERGGGAGVIVRIEGGGLSKQVIPAERWWHDVSVLGDATGDGIVDIEDILAVISAFGPCQDPCMADFDDNGVVDIEDMLTVIANFQG